MSEGQMDKIEQIDLKVEMQRSYLDYAMSVIVGRALPDVRDDQTSSSPSVRV
jgi:DNA gyrase subunit A